MKISSVLLSSAAIFVAGSVYAADLPAKKAAPAAAKSTECPAFGAGYFSIPGGETCIKINGYVRADSRYITNYPRPASTPFQLGYKFIVGVDTMSNTELGNVHSRVGFYDFQLTAGTSTSADTPTHIPGTVGLETAYIDIGGFRAGNAPSVVDYNNAYNNSGLQYQPPGVSQLAYTASLGGSTKLTVAAEATTYSDNNAELSSAVSVASRPDLIASVNSKMGDVVWQLGVVSHEVAAASGTGQGFATLGRMDATFGDMKLILGAGYASGATAYIDNPTTYGETTSAVKPLGGGIADSDVNGQNLATAQMQTAALEYKLGANTVYAYAGSENANGPSGTVGSLTLSGKYSKQIYGVGFKYPIGKTLYVRPEVYTYNEDKGLTTAAGSLQSYSAVYIRVRKDF